MRLFCPENASVIGYAMQIDEALVDAVPIEKEKAKQVFENEARAERNVSIVEKVSQSNCFKTRVNPLPFQEDKTIQVKYQIMLNETATSLQEKEEGIINSCVFIPMSYLNFEKLREDSKIEFSFNESSFKNLKSEIYLETLHNNNTDTSHQDGHDHDATMHDTISSQLIWSNNKFNYSSSHPHTDYHFELKKSDLNEHITGFTLNISQKTESTRDIQFAEKDGYFMTSIHVPSPPTEIISNENSEQPGKKIQILWDCSLSQGKQHVTICKLLRKILEKVEPSCIVFTCFSNAVVSNHEFSNGFGFSKLELFLTQQELTYDGGSNLLLLDRGMIDESVHYCIMFTN